MSDARIVATPVQQEIRPATGKQDTVDEHQRLLQRVDDERDDVLATLQLVAGDSLLEDRLFEQLVDLLVEGMFLDLRRCHLAGELSRDAYFTELTGLAEACRGVGLLPLPLRDA